MKFNIEIDIDWIDDDENLDSEIQKKIISGLVCKIEKEFSMETSKKIAQRAERLITAKTELLINTVLERSVVVSNGWNDTRTYDSIYDMIEIRMAGLYDGKLNNIGKCEKDPLLKNIEKYVDLHIGALLSEVDKKIRLYAETYAVNAVHDSELLKAFNLLIKDKSVPAA